MSDFLFAMPNFISGAGSVLDLGGTLLQFNISKNEREADAMALRSDRLAVGSDIRNAARELIHG